MDSRSATPKLKDSCDICAASKVRCDKQKPVCGRCTSLHYQCFYSPARRAGRPHRVRHGGSQQGDAQMNPSADGGRRAGLSAPLAPLVRDVELEMAMGDGGYSSLVDISPIAMTGQQQQQCWENPKPDSLLSGLVYGLELDGSTCTRQKPQCCARTAMDLLELLEVGAPGFGTERDAAQPNSRGPPPSARLAVTDSCWRLSTILICPCSEEPSVALLVASVCSALMDIYSVPVDATSSQLGQGQEDALLSGLENSMFAWSVISANNLLASPSSLSGTLMDDAVTDNQTVEGLASVAKVVLQFTERYWQGNGTGVDRAETTRLFGPIAAFLRLKLQSVTAEATRRLVH